MTHNELDAALDSGNPESAARWEAITRSAQMYCTALFGLSTGSAGDVLSLAGSGTLLAGNGAHYILTAAHVWDKVLRQSEKVGITLRQDGDHTCLFDRYTLIPFGPVKPPCWNEWGPDVILLRIPPSRVREIEAFKVFYDLDAVLQHQFQGDRNENYLLVGTPKALGEYKQNHASVNLVGMWVVGWPTHFDRSGHNYIDVKLSVPGVTSFGGVSGRSLWRVQIFWDQDRNKIDSKAVLEGVAFYELHDSDGSVTVRSHGESAIRNALASSHN
jgi:hypothetical protein